MSDPTPTPTQEFSSPPPAPRPPEPPRNDARIRLHQLADQLRQAPNRRALVEFLHLRRTLK